MKIVPLALIIFAFLTSFIDSIVCTNHASYEEKNVISFVKISDSSNQNNQTNFSPFDHCGVCTGICNGNLAGVINSNKDIFFSSPLVTKFNFLYRGLKLSIFLSSTERPPAIV